ncbi:hypothetical protein GCM10009835_25850 [Planosporangium flavigriseum]|uniref:Uncharacterized protein n=1 Tax=Planosporangium flavigriseum TaxID=373681 RepID=A0A8J3PJW7_9ACTN|nr:hypothetical protein Pfl04_06460 [Planosporangium flavigriseum]
MAFKPSDCCPARVNRHISHADTRPELHRDGRLTVCNDDCDRSRDTPAARVDRAQRRPPLARAQPQQWLVAR